MWQYTHTHTHTHTHTDTQTHKTERQTLFIGFRMLCLSEVCVGDGNGSREVEVMAMVVALRDPLMAIEDER